MRFKLVVKIVLVLCLLAVLCVQCLIIFLPDISRQVGRSMIGPLPGNQPFDFTVSRLGVNYTQISDLFYGNDLCLDSVRLTYRMDRQKIIRVEKIVVSGLNATVHVDENSTIKVSGFKYPNDNASDNSSSSFDTSELMPFLAYLPQQIVLKNSTIFIDTGKKKYCIPVQGDVNVDREALRAHISLSITPVDQKICIKGSFDLSKGQKQMKIRADVMEPGMLLAMAGVKTSVRDMFCGPVGGVIETKDFSKFDFRLDSLGVKPGPWGHLNIPEISGQFCMNETGMKGDAQGVITLSYPGITLDPFKFKVVSDMASAGLPQVDLTIENQGTGPWTFDLSQIDMPESKGLALDQVQVLNPGLRLFVSANTKAQTAQLTLDATNINVLAGEKTKPQDVLLDISPLQVKSELKANLLASGTASHVTLDALMGSIAFVHNDTQLSTGTLNLLSQAQFKVLDSGLILDHADARIRNCSMDFNQGDTRIRVPGFDIDCVLKKKSGSSKDVLDVNVMANNAKILSGPATVFAGKSGIKGWVENPASSDISMELTPWASKVSLDIKDKGIQVKGGYLKLPFVRPFKQKTAAGHAGVKKVTWYDKVSGSVSAKIVQTGDYAVDVAGKAAIGQGGLAIDFSGQAGLDTAMHPFANAAIRTNQVAVTRDALLGFVPQLSQIDELEFDLDASADLSWTDYQIKTLADIRISNGRLSSQDSGLSATGIFSDIHFNDLIAVETLPGQYINIESLKAGRFDFNNAKLRFSLEDGQSVNIENLKFNWCNGIVSTEAFRLPSDNKIINLTLYCDRLEMEDLFHQLGVFDAEGGGTLSGRIPVVMKNSEIGFDNGFLFSTPGEGGRIYIKGLDSVLAGIPKDTPEFSQLDLAEEALKNFEYKWVKLKLNTDQDTLLVNMELDGKPASVLPFEYKRNLNSFVRVDAQSPGSNFQGIKLDVNLTLPFNQVIQFGNNLKSIMNP